LLIRFVFFVRAGKWFLIAQKLFIRPYVRKTGGPEEEFTTETQREEKEGILATE